MSAHHSDEIDAALARFLDGEPEPEDAGTLADAMAVDPAFARELARLLELDDLLRQAAQPDGRAFVESLSMRLNEEKDDGAFLRRLGHLPRLERVGWPRRIGRLAAALIAAGILLSMPMLERRPGKLGLPQPPIETAERSPSATPEPVTAAVLTRMVDARWESPGVTLDEGVALPPCRLRLAQGLVQVELISGAAVILEGPCDFELVSADRAVCHRGKVRAHVPPSASGFTIAAPGIDAVDLGTEFALRVDEGGQSQIHVLAGAVELRGAGAHPPIQGVKMLKAGQAVDFGPDGGLREVAADPSAFVDRSGLLRLETAHHQQRYRAWRDHSRALRADESLVLYYTCEEKNTWQRTVKNLAASRPGRSGDGAVVGCLWCPGRWPEKSALEFKRTSDRVRINVPGEFDQLSLATWIRIEGLNRWLSALMLTDGWDLGEVHWMITGYGELLLGVSLPDSQNGDGHRSPPVLGPNDLGRWVHLASVYDRRTNVIVHYLDGKRVSEGFLRVPTALRIGSANLGNWNPGPDFQKNSRRSLNARIDEFAIFQRALTDDEVRRMYELGKPSS